MKDQQWQLLDQKMSERLLGEIITDGQGTTKRVYELPTPILIRKPQFTPGTKCFSDHLDEMQAVQEQRRLNNPWQEEVDIKVDCASEWFGIRPISDLHIGGEGVDYQRVREVIGGLGSFNNLTTILLGDIGDFFIPGGKHKDGMLGQVGNPQDQLDAITKFFNEYKDKILAMSNDPSHVDWVQQTTGIDAYRVMSKDTGIPLVNQGGRIGIDFGDVNYDIIPFHNIGRFKSSFNLTHAGKRVLELHRDGDAVISGHIHHSAYEIARRNGHKIALIQCGTTKTSDSWGAKMGFLGRPDSDYPVLLLNTKRKKISVAQDMEEASYYLR
jgi:hypothetical protein